eukprot:g69545.t1
MEEDKRRKKKKGQEGRDEQEIDEAKEVLEEAAKDNKQGQRGGERCIEYFFCFYLCFKLRQADSRALRWALGVFGLLLPLLVAADRVFQPWGLYCVAVPYSAVAVWLPALLLLLFGLVAQAFLYQHYWPLLQFARKAAKAQAEQAAALDDNLGPRQDKNGRRLSMTPRLFRQTEELKRLSAFGQHAFWMSCSFYVLRLPLVLTLIGVLDAGKPDRAGLSAAQYVIQILAISSSMVNAWLVARVLHRVRDLALSPPPKPEVSLPPPLAAAVARPGSRLNQRRQSGGWSYYPTHAYGSEDHMHMGVQPEPEPPAAKAEQQARKSTSQKQEPVKKRISGYMTNFAKRTRRSLSLPGLLEARESVNEQEDNSSWGLSQPNGQSEPAQQKKDLAAAQRRRRELLQEALQDPTQLSDMQDALTNPKPMGYETEALRSFINDLEKPVSSAMGTWQVSNNDSDGQRVGLGTPEATPTESGPVGMFKTEIKQQPNEVKSHRRSESNNPTQKRRASLIEQQMIVDPGVLDKFADSLVNPVPLGYEDRSLRNFADALSDPSPVMRAQSSESAAPSRSTSGRRPDLDLASSKSGRSLGNLLSTLEPMPESKHHARASSTSATGRMSVSKKRKTAAVKPSHSPPDTRFHMPHSLSAESIPISRSSSAPLVPPASSGSATLKPQNSLEHLNKSLQRLSMLVDENPPGAEDDDHDDSD